MAHHSLNLAQDVRFQPAPVSADATRLFLGDAAFSGRSMLLRDVLLDWSLAWENFGVRSFWGAAGRWRRHQQALAIEIDQRHGPQWLQKTCKQLYLHRTWPRADFQLVRLHAVLVLGQLASDRHGFYSLERGAVAGCLAVDLVIRNCHIDRMGMASWRDGQGKNRRGAIGLQPICTRRVRDRARVGFGCSDRSAQPTRTGYCLQDLLIARTTTGGKRKLKREGVNPATAGKLAAALPGFVQCTAQSVAGLFDTGATL